MRSKALTSRCSSIVSEEGKKNNFFANLGGGVRPTGAPPIWPSGASPAPHCRCGLAWQSELPRRSRARRSQPRRRRRRRRERRRPPTRRRRPRSRPSAASALAPRRRPRPRHRHRPSPPSALVAARRRPRRPPRRRRSRRPSALATSAAPRRRPTAAAVAAAQACLQDALLWRWRRLDRALLALAARCAQGGAPGRAQARGALLRRAFVQDALLRRRRLR